MRKKALASDGSSPNLRTIANALGISIATVDRAIHDRGRISAETRARVLQMVDELGYKPNLAARHLKLNRQFRISVILPSTIAAFFDEVRSGIREAALPFRTAMILSDFSYQRSDQQPQRNIRSALKNGTDGIILTASSTQSMTNLLQKAKNQGVTTICVVTDVPDSGRLTTVMAHPFTCGAMSAEVLVNTTRRPGPIAVLAGDITNHNQTEKVRGLQITLAKFSKRHTLGAVIESHDDPSGAYQQIRSLLRRHKDLRGLYIASANSIPAIRALKELGRLHDLSIVTTDLFPELVPYIRDGVVRATIHQCPEQQGSIAIRTMFNYLSDGIVPNTSIEVTPQLVMRSNLDLYTKEPPGTFGL